MKDNWVRRGRRGDFSAKMLLNPFRMLVLDVALAIFYFAAQGTADAQLTIVIVSEKVGPLTELHRPGAWY
jgi:hypothetical protein